jgi:DNA-binding response OmpR family regulator
MKILVIDDFSYIAFGIRGYFEGHGVNHEYRIPNDLSDLDKYDVLIVDNQGIGNMTYKSGSDLLKNYTPKNQSQLVIYHSGLSPEREFAELLQSKGFKYFVKGSDPDKLVAMVNEHFHS